MSEWRYIIIGATRGRYDKARVVVPAVSFEDAVHTDVYMFAHDVRAADELMKRICREATELSVHIRPVPSRRVVLIGDLERPKRIQVINTKDQKPDRFYGITGEFHEWA